LYANEKIRYTRKQGILTGGRRLSTVGLLIEVACFVKNVNNKFNANKS
jgi:hypothetical protein